MSSVITNPHEHKRCPRCGEIKPISRFSANRTTKTGIDYYCMACRKKLANDRYAANPERGRAASAVYYRDHIALIKEQNAARSEVIRSMAVSSGCAITGATEKLVFHHLDPASKRFAISLSGSRSWNTIFQEMDKCIVVTRSMHRKIHAVLAGKRVKDPSPEFIRFMRMYYGMVISEDGRGFKVKSSDLRSAAIFREEHKGETALISRHQSEADRRKSHLTSVCTR